MAIKGMWKILCENLHAIGGMGFKFPYIHEIDACWVPGLGFRHGMVSDIS